MSLAASYSAGELKKPSIGVIAFAGSIGTIIEWYDFLIYGTASALVFNTLFFPNIDPKLGRWQHWVRSRRLPGKAGRRLDLWPLRRSAGSQIDAHADHGA